MDIAHIENILAAIFGVVFVVYIIAAVSHFTSIATKSEKLRKIGFIIFVVAAVGHLAYFILRWWAKFNFLDLTFLTSAPLRGAFEYAMTFALVISIIYILGRPRYPWLAGVGMPATILLLAFAATRNMAMQDLVDALRSPWFFVHAGTGAVAYGAFAIAAACGVKYLSMLKKGEKDSSKVMIQIDQISYRAIAFGMLFFTITIISGSLWAVDAWSAFWSWDPKELWSLITWIFYIILLHQRLRMGWRGKRSAILAIVGISLVIFTWVGVNNLLPGLHSY